MVPTESCRGSGQVPSAPRPSAEPRASAAPERFRVEVERFADARILRYRVPGFEKLDLAAKKLVYCLYEAALCGREIIYDQKYRYNLAVKRTLEQLIKHYPGERETEEFEALVLYAKRVWFSNGIHHHYSNDKFEPGFSFESFARWVRATPGEFPLRPGQSLGDFLAELEPILFDPRVDAKLVNKGVGLDVVESSAVNFYRDVTQREVEAYYAARKDSEDATPVSHGLNSRLARVADGVSEQTWKVGGIYGEALERVVAWLERAEGMAENDAQRDALAKLTRYLRSGDLRDWDRYNIAWVEDDDSRVDTINGFIEVYHDPLGMRGAYEAIVSIRDPVATRRIDAIAGAAEWFELHSPIPRLYKKDNVTGITGKVIDVVVEAGDSSPTTPIGINLPNADWIRRDHGSKSVSLANISAAYAAVQGEATAEFAWDEAERERAERHGALASELHTEMHEVIGHASGRLKPGVGAVHETLKQYASTIEEARADLVALYFAVDPKLIELGAMPSIEVGWTEYDSYIRNGLLQQLSRVRRGGELEEDHMRNRQLIAAWVYERGMRERVIERRRREGKTFFQIRDYERLRALFGALLREVQRIKSEGDYRAARELVETYGVKVDRALHAEVLERYAKLDIPPYAGFVNPRLVPVERDGEIVDVRIEYPEDFAAQMLEYAQRYAFLPTWN